MSEKLTTHTWQYQTTRWICTTCGHSFDWDPKDKVPLNFDADGSPVRGDPAWFKFHIVGLLSFIDAGKGMSDEMRRKFVKMVGMDPKESGSHAAAFQHCLLEQEMDNYAFVDQVMSE